jgi:hypothetical protein
VVAGLAVAGNPVTRAGDAWDSFKGGYAESDGGTRLLSGLGSNRYDFYRVGLDRFLAHPVAGIGADNFQQDYLARARSGEQPRYPHSVELRTLSQTGIVGAALLVLGLGAAGWAAALAIRRRAGLGAATAAAGLTCFVSWFVHGSVDWFWEFAGLGTLAFAALGVAAGLVPRRAGQTRPLARGAVLGSGVGVVAVVAALSMAAPWLAQRDVNDAVDNWAASPSDAFDTLDRAASLNPVSPLPDLVAGSIALQLHRWDQAERLFREAQSRDPRSQFAELELGLLAARGDRQREAEARLARAVAMSPRDLIARGALRRVRAGRPVNIASVNHQLAQQTENLGR